MKTIVKNSVDLRKIIEDGIIPLDTIDTSEIIDMYGLFNGIKEINGSIANWDVSAVEDMGSMFFNSKINQDISKWDVKNVHNMEEMFYESEFNGDISSWDVSEVVNMDHMFYRSKFNGDLSKWKTSSLEGIYGMFRSSQFNGDISNWYIDGIVSMQELFEGSTFNQNLGKWDLSYFDNSYLLEVFKGAYSLSQYNKDREEYLNNIELEKNQKENDKYLLEEKQRINNQLNKEIELDTFEMEF